jgi:hypothetical protein
MSNELNEEIKKIYNEIQKDWNLTGKLTKDFIAITIMEFKNNESSIKDNRVLEDFSKNLLKKIYGGFDLYLGKFGINHLDQILQKWIEQSIDNEAQRRIKESRTASADAERSQPDLNNLNKAEGGLVYIQ